MGKAKRIISILISVIVVLSAIYFPIRILAQSNSNILKDSTITANAEYYNGWYEYNRPIGALVDGNTYVGVGYNAGNMFATEFSADGLAYVNFKLTTATTLNKLVVYLAGTSAAQTDIITDYAVDVKLLDESWKRVAEKHTEFFDNWDAYVETLCFEEVTVSEVQITIKNVKGQKYASIYEIEALYDDTITSDDYTDLDTSDVKIDMPKPTNILANEIATCSSGYNNWYAENRPLSKLTDGKYTGNAGEMWAIDYVDGYAYFEFEFDDVKSVNKIITSFPGSAAGVTNIKETEDSKPQILQIKDYAIDGLLEDGSWTRLAERHIDSNDEAVDYYSDIVLFESARVKKLRFTFANAYNQQWAAVREVEAYYDNLVTSNDYTQSECKDFTEYAIVKPEYENILKDAIEITANEAYYNGWYPDNRSLLNLIDGNTFVGVGYNAGSAAVIPYEDDGQAYINFKLNKKSVINKITIHFPGLSACAKELQVDSYAVEVKLEEEWKRVAVRNIENSDNWDAYSDTVIFNKVECEEVRIIFVRENGQQTLSVFEIEVIADNRLIDSEVEPEEPPEELPVILENLLKDVTEITANGEYYNGWYPDNRALSNLIDGNTFVGVGYNAGSAAVIPYGANSEAYVNLKLKEKTTLNKLDIYFPGTSAYPKTEQVKCYIVEVKSDNEWKRVAVRNIENSDNWDAYSDTATFNKAQCEEIRIIFIKAKGQETVPLFEIEGYYDPQIEDSDEPLDEPMEKPEEDTPEEDTPQQPEKEFDNILKNVTEITANKAYYNGWYPDNRALSNLIDGNTFVGVGYNAGSAAVIPYEADGDTYVNFKLKKKTAVNQINIYFPGTSAYSLEQQVKCYVIEVKTGKEWKRVAVHNIKNSNNWDAYSDSATFNKIECEEIRIIFIKSKGQETVSLFEIEAYYDPNIKNSNKPLEKIPELPTNILKTSTEITANKAYYNGWYPDNRALSNLIDGNTFVGVGYNAGSAAVIPYEVNGDTYVNFKLKKKTAVNQVNVYFPGTSAYPIEQQVKCYVIEVKTGKKWERVAVRNIEISENWDAYSDTATFNKVKCEEIRIIFIKSKGQETLSLFEVEAYYDPDIKNSNKPLEEIPKAPANILKNANKITANDAYYNGWYPTNRPLSKTIDGDTSFKFDASKATMIPYGSSKLAFIQYDFDKSVKANKLLYYSPDAGDENTMPLTNRLTDYAVDVKLSDGTWKRIIEHHGDRVEDWDIYYDEYLFETVEFIALRFVSKSADSQTYLAISELELNFDVNEENKTPYMNRYVSNKLSCTSNKINNSMFGTQREIEMPIVSVILGIIPTTGLGDNSWYKTERPLKNITDGVQDVFTPANISTIDYHDNVAYYNFELDSCKKVNTVRFFVPQKDLNAIKERPTDFAVDVMLRDGTWKRVAEKHIAVNKDEAGYCETITFETEECMQIRLTSVSNGKMSYFALSEIEVYFNTYLAKGFTGIQKSPSLEREVPYPKIRLVPIAKFN